MVNLNGQEEREQEVGRKRKTTRKKKNKKDERKKSEKKKESLTLRQFKGVGGLVLRNGCKTKLPGGVTTPTLYFTYNYSREGGL